MTKVILPPISQRLVDDSGQAVKEWYDKLKFLERLQPLSDIDNTTLLATLAALYSPITRTINAQTGTTYTFVLGDAGAFCTFGNAGATTVTVPPNSSVAFPTGTQIDVSQVDAGKVTLAQGAGVTINSVSAFKALSAQYAGGTLVKTATDTWLLVGSLIA